jgi:hypothetical protein
MKILCRFVVACGTSSIVLQAIPKAFDLVAVTVEIGINLMLDSIGAARGDYRFDATLAESGSPRLAVIAFIANQGIGAKLTERCPSVRDVRLLPCAQVKTG